MEGECACATGRLRETWMKKVCYIERKIKKVRVSVT